MHRKVWEVLQQSKGKQKNSYYSPKVQMSLKITIHSYKCERVFISLINTLKTTPTSALRFPISKFEDFT